MDKDQYSEDLFADSEDVDNGESLQEKETRLNENEKEAVINMAETETFEEPLRLESLEVESVLENLVTEPENDDENELEAEEMEMETPDLDLDDDDDIVEENVPAPKPLELQQADFTSGVKVSVTKKDSQPSKLINLPMGRVKSIMKLDPDVRLMSREAVFVITKATELFIGSLAKECMVQKDPKKKTIQKRDVDQVFASADALMFLEGAMDF